MLGVLVAGAVAPASALANAYLTGTVTSTADGSGIAGVNVNIYATGSTTPFITEPTGSGGAYETGALAPGSYQVQLDGSTLGYSSECTTARAARAAPRRSS